MAFGLSMAATKSGNPLVAFSTMIVTDQQLDDLSELMNVIIIYLRTRVGNEITWENRDPWKNEASWKDEGTESLPPNFGSGLRVLAPDYWKIKLLLPRLAVFYQSPQTPVDELLIRNKKLLTGLQMDFYTSLALDANDNLYLAYVDGSNTGREVIVIRKNGAEYMLPPGAGYRYGSRESGKQWVFLLRQAVVYILTPASSLEDY